MYTGSVPGMSISEDLMEAYMLAEEPPRGESYTVEYLKDVLRINNIKIGIIEDALRMICAGDYYGEPVLVAKGESASNGVDGRFAYFFDREFNSKPTIKEDGTADYHTLKMIETVKSGQEIARYYPPTKGSNGFNIGAKFIMAIPGKDLPKLRGSGFDIKELENGEISYVANIEGKITESNGRITIKPVHELNGDLDLTHGNIDFNGDVIIHGKVINGMEIKAEGPVTVDGVVEAATIYGKKGIVLRSGVVGCEGAVISSKGDITARFLEYAKVSCGGNIEAEAFLDSDVECDGTITLKGRKSSIVGGHVHANLGIDIQNAGNEKEIATHLSVGLPKTLLIRGEEIKTKLADDKRYMKKIDDALAQIEVFRKQEPDNQEINDKRQMLSIEHIRTHAIIAGEEDELKKLNEAKMNSLNAVIRVQRMVYGGVVIGLGQDIIKVSEEHDCVEFKREGGLIKMFSMKITANK